MVSNARTRSLAVSEKPLPSASGELMRYDGPRWLAEWTPDQPVPVSADDLRLALAAIDSALQPPSRQVVAAALVLLCDAFGWANNWEAQSPLYLDALADMPADLLMVAIHRTIRCRRHEEYFPWPGDIRAAVSDELQRRAHCRRRLGAALAAAERAA